MFEIEYSVTVSNEIDGNSIEDFDSEEALPHPYQWNNFSPEEVANHDENAARNVLRRMHHVNDIVPRDFVEVCVDMKQQGVGGQTGMGIFADDGQGKI